MNRTEEKDEKFRRVACIHVAASGTQGDVQGAGQAEPETEFDFDEVRKEAFAQGYAKGEKEAHAKGYRQGEAEGKKSGQASVAPLMQNLAQAVAEIEKVKEQLFRSAEKEAVSLAMAIARKIIHTEVSTSEQAVLGVVQKALGQAAGNETIRIRMNPDDINRIDSLRQQLSLELEDGGRLQFITDGTVASGGCLIETDMGSIDARIEKQLQVVEEAFHSQLSDHLN